MIKLIVIWLLIGIITRFVMKYTSLKTLYKIAKENNPQTAKSFNFDYLVDEFYKDMMPFGYNWYYILGFIGVFISALYIYKFPEMGPNICLYFDYTKDE